MRRSHRREEIERLLNDGRRAGRTYAEIAADAGIARSTLAHWAWRLRRERGATETKFIELVAPEADAKSEDRVEVALRSGRRLWAPAGIDGRRLAELVAALEAC